jgi:CDP-diacylglycerol---serine O-phosphatidyltransferase
MRRRQAVPAVITVLALACGLAAFEAARGEHWAWAFRLILLAAVFDGADGVLARRLAVAGPMGQQLDSLSDVVTFGAAPAFLFISYYSGSPDVIRFTVALVFLSAGMFRLARYNTRPASSSFSGLPITAAGVLFAAVTTGPLAGQYAFASIAGLMLGALMVSTHPFPTLSKARAKMLPALIPIFIPVVLWPHVETVALIAAGGIGLYLVWGLLSRFVDHEGSSAVAEVTGAGSPRP